MSQLTIDLIDDVDTGIDTNTVYYVLTQCPVRRCRSTNVPVQHTEGKIRFHKCVKCGYKFKSLEYPLIQPEQ